jgi:glutamate formiminotransferase/formiminotetrahydrofolate cyclodeaminase
MNLTDYKITPPHIAFEAVYDAAKRRGVNVTGSEIIGLVPLEAMLMAGRYYINSKKNKNELKEYELLCLAIESLGLNDINSFIPEEMIIEYKLKR